MVKGLNVDGITYDVAVGVKRKTRIVSSDVSGTMLNGDYYFDPLGSYSDYTITIAVPAGNETEYKELYERLTNVQYLYHTFILPYDQTNIQTKGRVELINDELFRVEGAVTLWRAISFDILASEFTTYYNEAIMTEDDTN